MKNVWFKKWGWCHYPISWQGGVITVLAVIFLINIFYAIDRNSHSVSDTLYGIFPFYGVTFLILEWIASKSD